VGEAEVLLRGLDHLLKSRLKKGGAHTILPTKNQKKLFVRGVLLSFTEKAEEEDEIDADQIRECRQEF